LAGKQSVDENSSSVFVGVARRLGYPLLTNVVKVVEIADGQLTVERLVEGAQERVCAPLPAVVSVGKEINEPRYPSFLGIRKATKAVIPVLGVGDLDVDDMAATTQWTNIRKPEVRKTAVRLIDGASVSEKATKLVDALLADKVL
jgi:electron transfer flavoprotein beta subunit